MDYKFSAIILAKRDIREFDRMYTAYTKEIGKTRIVARGVRKPNSKLAGNIEPITECELFVAKNKGRGQLTGAIATSNFIRIKTEIELTKRVFYAFSILRRIMTDEEKDEKIFYLLENYLETMDKINLDDKLSMRADILTSGFIFKLFDFLGYMIEAQKCVSCEEKLSGENNYFSMKGGGVLCERCHGREARKVKVSRAAIKILRIFSANKLDNLVKLSVPKEDVRNIKIVLEEMVRWTTG